MAHRPYKEPMTVAQAAEIIVRGRGSHFDPDVVSAFLRILPACELVAQRYSRTSRAQRPPASK
jgi:putative two-component system response regulator